jgi:hypothetical protein
MITPTGFSCPYVTLAVGLRLAFADFLACKNAIDRSSIVAAIEIPRARAYVVVLLNAALCEATINTALALHFGTAEWKRLEGSNSTVSKWSTIPKRVWPNYSFSDSDPLLDELKALFAFRDSIMHSQPEVFDGVVRRHEGKFPGQRATDYTVIEQSFDLSLRLLRHLKTFDPHAWLHHDTIREQLTLPVIAEE